MPETQSGADRFARRWPTVALTILVSVGVIWSLVPFPIWFSGGDPSEIWDAWSVWLLGGVITLGVTFVLVLVSGGRIGSWLLAGWAKGPGSWATPVFLALAAITLAVLSIFFTLTIAHGNASYVDGFAQLFQARIFQSGRLFADPPDLAAHFSTLHMIASPDKWFSQFPPGQPLMLALGLTAGVWWLLNPLVAALLVLGTYRVASWAMGDSVGRVAVLLLCVSTFIVAMSGTAMNHLAAATIGIGAASCATVLTSRHRYLFAMAAGLLLGVMTAFRPLDAVAAAVPVAFIVWISSRHRLSDFLLVFLGGVLGTLPTLWFNAQTTGHWFEFGYNHLWGANHSLGFHAVPFGTPLTLLRAVGITGMDLHLVNRYLFDLPIPLAVVVAAAVLLGRKNLGVRDLLPVLGIVALVGSLFFYWHRDTLYGPRFLFSAAPWFIVLTARSIQLLRQRQKGMHLVTAFVVAMVFGALMLTPTRLIAYRDSTPTFDYHPDRDAAAADIGNAVVVIPDGWGSRLIARMWARGVSMERSNQVYASVDACTLHHALDSTGGDVDLERQLDSLVSLGRPGIPVDLTADQNLRLPSDGVLTPDCIDEINFDRAGFLAFGPYLYLNNASLDGDIVWGRDMRAGNAALVRAYPNRRYYRYEVGSDGPRFTELELVDTSR